MFHLWGKLSQVCIVELLQPAINGKIIINYFVLLR